MRLRLSLIVSLVGCLLSTTSAFYSQTSSPRILQVGPGKSYRNPSQAAAVAKDGDIVEISAGTYNGDVAVWGANNLTLRGVGGRPHLKANGASAEGKAIWVIRGNATVENIEFSGVKVEDHNGVGIRQEGSKLTVRNCYFHDSEGGILTSNDPNMEVVIEGSEFANSASEFMHNIYVGHIRSFRLESSYVHNAKAAHNVKSRAATNYILYNRIMDEETGSASYEIDLPNGGRSFVIGNVIHKGRDAENSSVIAYAAEKPDQPSQEVYIVNNTIVSDLRETVFVNVHNAPTRALIINNLLVGAGSILRGMGTAHHNLLTTNAALKNRATYDYHLTEGSPAINKGINPGISGDFILLPTRQYVHPLLTEPRTLVESIDLGAYEYGSH
jgi:hypothetical protein